MSKIGFATLSEQDGAQTVRLPDQMRLPGTEVRVRRVGQGVMLKPIVKTQEDIAAIFAELDRPNREYGPFMPEGRQ